MKPRILITGGSGLLALNWAQALRDSFDIILGMHNRSINLRGAITKKIDLESLESFGSLLEEIIPDVVIHAAGLTSVDQCESDPSLAHHINVTLTENVAKACLRAGVQLVYISTDHLFSGTNQMVDEDHPVFPINVYGKTKAYAEALVLDINAQSLVIRTNFYGWGPSYRKSFSDSIIDTLRSGSQIQLFQDVFFTPILAESVGMLVHNLIGLKVSGIYNIVGDERISKYDFGLAIAQEFDLEPNRIIPCRISNQSSLTQRPHDMSLSNIKVKNLLGYSPGDVKAQIAKLHQLDLIGRARELREI